LEVRQGIYLDDPSGYDLRPMTTLRKSLPPDKVAPASSCVVAKRLVGLMKMVTSLSLGILIDQPCLLLIGQLRQVSRKV
jgi:hypothetical protein